MEATTTLASELSRVNQAMLRFEVESTLAQEEIEKLRAEWSRLFAATPSPEHVVSLPGRWRYEERKRTVAEVREEEEQSQSHRMVSFDDE